VKPWFAGYAVCLMLIVFGLLPLMLGRGSLDEQAKLEQALVQQGVPVTAIVTRKWHQSGQAGYQSVEYRYTVAGTRYDGLADPGLEKWSELERGSPLQVVYLPSDPSKSDYNPQRWLNSSKTANVWSTVFAAVGLVALIITGSLDIRRHQTGQELGVEVTENAGVIGDGPIQMVEERTYRLSPAIILFGLVFFVAGLLFQIHILRQILSGEGIMVSSQNSVSKAGPLGEFLTALFPILFWGIGLVFIIYWINFRVTVSQLGIKVRAIFGREFDWKWGDIRIAERKYNQGAYYKIGDADGTVMIPQSMMGAQELSRTLDNHLAKFFH